MLTDDFLDYFRTERNKSDLTVESYRIDLEEFILGQSGSLSKCKGCGRSVRPDLVIHERNSNPGLGNGLVAEFKREKAQEMSVDLAKIQYFTCENGVLKYLIGAVVTLSKTKQNVVLYRNSEIVCHVSVYEDRVVYEHE